MKIKVLKRVAAVSLAVAMAAGTLTGPGSIFLDGLAQETEIEMQTDMSETEAPAAGSEIPAAEQTAETEAPTPEDADDETAPEEMSEEETAAPAEEEQETTPDIEEETAGEEETEALTEPETDELQTETQITSVSISNGWQDGQTQHLEICLSREAGLDGVSGGLEVLDAAKTDAAETSLEAALLGREIEPYLAATLSLAKDGAACQPGNMDAKLGRFDSGILEYDRLSFRDPDGVWEELDAEFLQGGDGVSAHFVIDGGGTLVFWREQPEGQSEEETELQAEPQTQEQSELQTGEQTELQLESETEMQTESQAERFFCGLEEHIHTEACLDEEGKLICGKEKHTHTEECKKEQETGSEEDDTEDDGEILEISSEDGIMPTSTGDVVWTPTFKVNYPGTGAYSGHITATFKCTEQSYYLNDDHKYESTATEKDGKLVFDPVVFNYSNATFKFQLSNIIIADGYKSSVSVSNQEYSLKFDPVSTSVCVLINYLSGSHLNRCIANAYLEASSGSSLGILNNSDRQEIDSSLLNVIEINVNESKEQVYTPLVWNPEIKAEAHGNLELGKLSVQITSDKSNPADSNYSEEQYLTSNSGTLNFSPITFSKPGRYKYEIDPSSWYNTDDGKYYNLLACIYKGDTRINSVVALTVSVKADSDGTLYITNAIMAGAYTAYENIKDTIIDSDTTDTSLLNSVNASFTEFKSIEWHAKIPVSYPNDGTDHSGALTVILNEEVTEQNGQLDFGTIGLSYGSYRFDFKAVRNIDGYGACLCTGGNKVDLSTAKLYIDIGSDEEGNLYLNEAYIEGSNYNYQFGIVNNKTEVSDIDDLNKLLSIEVYKPGIEWNPKIPVSYYKGIGTRDEQKITGYVSATSVRIQNEELQYESQATETEGFLSFDPVRIVNPGEYNFTFDCTGGGIAYIVADGQRIRLDGSVFTVNAEKSGTGRIVITGAYLKTGSGTTITLVSETESTEEFPDIGFDVDILNYTAIRWSPSIPVSYFSHGAVAGQELDGSEYYEDLTLTLSCGDCNYSSARVNTDGTLVFDPVTFHAPGTYEFSYKATTKGEEYTVCLSAENYSHNFALADAYLDIVIGSDSDGNLYLQNASMVNKPETLKPENPVEIVSGDTSDMGELNVLHISVNLCEYKPFVWEPLFPVSVYDGSMNTGTELPVSDYIGKYFYIKCGGDQTKIDSTGKNVYSDPISYTKAGQYYFSLPIYRNGDTGFEYNTYLVTKDGVKYDPNNSQIKLKIETDDITGALYIQTVTIGYYNNKIAENIYDPSELNMFRFVIEIYKEKAQPLVWNPEITVTYFANGIDAGNEVVDTDYSGKLSVTMARSKRDETYGKDIYDYISTATNKNGKLIFSPMTFTEPNTYNITFEDIQGVDNYGNSTFTYISINNHRYNFNLAEAKLSIVVEYDDDHNLCISRAYLKAPDLLDRFTYQYFNIIPQDSAVYDTALLNSIDISVNLTGPSKGPTATVNIMYDLAGAYTPDDDENFDYDLAQKIVELSDGLTIRYMRDRYSSSYRYYLDTVTGSSAAFPVSYLDSSEGSKYLQGLGCYDIDVKALVSEMREKDEEKVFQGKDNSLDISLKVYDSHSGKLVYETTDKQTLKKPNGTSGTMNYITPFAVEADGDYVAYLYISKSYNPAIIPCAFGDQYMFYVENGMVTLTSSMHLGGLTKYAKTHENLFGNNLPQYRYETSIGGTDYYDPSLANLDNIISSGENSFFIMPVDNGIMPINGGEYGNLRYFYRHYREGVQPVFNLRIAKQVKGAMADMNKKFSFRLTLTPADGGDPIPEPVKYSLNGGPESEVSFASGSYDFELGDGDSITFLELPSGTTYKAEELNAKSEGYLVECVNPEGVIEDDVDVVITNTKDAVVPTGIWTGMSAWILFLLASAAALIAAFKLGRKKL